MPQTEIFIHSSREFRAALKTIAWNRGIKMQALLKEILSDIEKQYPDSIKLKKKDTRNNGQLLIYDVNNSIAHRIVNIAAHHGQSTGSFLRLRLQEFIDKHTG